MIKITLSQAKNILSHYSLGDLTTLEEIKSGSINPVFLANKKYILRFDLGNPDYQDKLKKESTLFNLLSKHSIPTPKLIAFDTSCTLVKYPYFIISYLLGRDLKAIFPELDTTTQKILSTELGTLLKNIHTLKPQDLIGYGDFGDIDSWVAKIKKNFLIYFNFVKDNNYLPPEIIAQTEQVFSDYQQLTNWQDVACLTHGDINPGNIKVDNGHISGIFDFEYACIADPFIDLERLPINFLLGANFDQKLFLKGFGFSKLSYEELTRMKTYCLSQGLWEIWATATQQFPYGPEVIEEGKILIINTLRFTNYYD